MLDLAILAAQALATGLIAGWLTLGVRDNILHPDVNRVYTGEVMQMTRMRTEYPEAFAQVAHRAVTSPTVHRTAFRAVIVAELLATAVLWAGVACLLLAVAGLAAAETARGVALVGAMLFTAVWGSFLIVGNHFCYWFCHVEAQNTHYQMTLWGVGTMVLLAIP